MNQYNQSLPDETAQMIKKINKIYFDYFDQSWFTMFLDDFPMTSGQFYDIRYALNIVVPTGMDIPVLRQGIAMLELFIQLTREIVMPRVTEYAGNRNVKNVSRAMSREMSTQRKIIAYSLPANIQTLETLVSRLKSLIPASSAKFSPKYTRKIPRMF